MTDALYLEPSKTFVTEIDIIHAVKLTYRALFGVEASLETLAILCAQIFFECGRGKECWNYNLGNVKRTKGHAWTAYKCSEYINSKLTYFQPPHPQTHFNAYQSLPEAAQEHLRFLAGDRYQDALDRANNCDAVGYCMSLKKAGYYTDTLEHYTNTLVSIFKEILRKYPNEAEPDPYAQ